MKTSSLERTEKALRGQRGQLVLEYVLILLIVVTIAALVTRMMVRRGPELEDQGFVVKAWTFLLFEIGSDPADEAR